MFVRNVASFLNVVKNFTCLVVPRQVTLQSRKCDNVSQYSGSIRQVTRKWGAYPSFEFVPEEAVEVVVTTAVLRPGSLAPDGPGPTHAPPAEVTRIVPGLRVVDPLDRHDEPRTTPALSLVTVRMTETLVLTDKVRRVGYLHDNLQYKKYSDILSPRIHALSW